MGTAALASFDALSNLFFKKSPAETSDTLGFNRGKRAHDAPSVPISLASSKPKETAAATLDANREQALAQSFDTSVQWSKMREVSLAVKMRQAAAQTKTEGATGGSDAETRQMTFDFFASSRIEEKASFALYTQKTAEGLDGGRRTTYAEASASVSKRFEFSMSISGSALEGFAGASDKLASASDLFDRLMSLTSDLLGESDDKFNEIMSLLGGNAVDTDKKSFSDLAEEMMNTFMRDLFGNAGSAPASLQSGATNASSASSAQLEFKFSMSVEVNAQISVQQTQDTVQKSDPIVFDLDGDGMELTSFRDGAKFDILGNGAKATTAFVTGGDAFLALDRNKNGLIDSGTELFGDQRGAVNGYEELRKLDTNSDSVIDARDAAYGDLKLWKDNGDGVSAEGEMVSLAQAGIAEINLNYANTNELVSGGNRLAQRSTFRWADGTQGRTADAILNYTA